MTVVLVAAILAAGVAWWAREMAQRRSHPVPPGHRADIVLPCEREFALYHNALSLCSMKTRVCLSELGIPYTSHHIDLIETGAYENLRPSFLAVNPAGTVPVLVHRGHPVYESHEQIRYAAAHAPPGSPSLVPGDPALRESMERWIDRSSLTDDPIAQGDRRCRQRDSRRDGAALRGDDRGHSVPAHPRGDPVPASDRRRPVMLLVLKAVGVERLDRIAPAMKMLARSRRQLGVHLDALERQLRCGGGPWILGDSFSLADVSWLVIFERLVQADALHVLVDPARRPECSAYWTRLRERPKLPRRDSRPRARDDRPRHEAAARGEGGSSRAADGARGCGVPRLVRFGQARDLVGEREAVQLGSLGALHRQVRATELVAQRAEQDRVALEPPQRLLQRRRQPFDAACRPLGLVELPQMDGVDRRRQVEAALDAVEARGDHPCEREIRLALASLALSSTLVGAPRRSVGTRSGASL